MPTNRPSRFGRPLSSIYTGAILIGLIVVYLAVVSVATDWAAGVMRTTADGVYRHPVFVALCLAVCVNILLATLIRIPLRTERLGAWISHTGVGLLATGSVIYFLAGTKGDCVSVFDGHRWSPIRYVYEEDTRAIYFSSAETTEPLMVPVFGIDPVDPRPIVPLDVPLPGLEGVALRATAFMPDTVVTLSWKNDAPTPTPAARLRILPTGHQHWQQLTLCPSIREHAQYAGRGFVMIFRPGISPENLDRIATPTGPGGGPGMPHDLLLMLTGPEIDPTAVLIRPDGTRWRKTLKPKGKAIEVPTGGRTLLALEKIFTHARTHLTTSAFDPTRRPRAQHRPVLRVEAHAGNHRSTHDIPFNPFVGIDHRPVKLTFPNKQSVHLDFSRVRHGLPATLQILHHEFRTQPGSSVPQDYICQVRLSAGGQVEHEVVRLNRPLRVGPYQISQGSWTPDGRGGYWAIRFLAATRPGLPLIWLGCFLVCLGFPYAFYVKPAIIRARINRRGAE